MAQSKETFGDYRVFTFLYFASLYTVSSKSFSPTKSSIYNCSCLTFVTWEIVTWTGVCCYCCVLDCEISTSSWEGIETLTFFWENVILISAYEVTETFSWGYGSEMCFWRWEIGNETFGGDSGNEIAFYMKFNVKSTAKRICIYIRICGSPGYKLNIILLHIIVLLCLKCHSAKFLLRAGLICTV